ncbi:Fc.00g034520.m01.CDS01 [Cosmosporella sp. VM-42]
MLNLLYNAVPKILGIFSIGAIAIILHTIVYNRKSSSRIHPFASQSGQAQPKKVTTPEYVDVFPPFQRDVLSDVAPQLASNAPAAGDLTISPKSLLKLDADYRLAESSTYNFSGFTVGEIRGLGNFPDYGKLSGVPLPSPLENFNVDKARPRPYRPFRWAYHQTMSLTKLDPDYWLELESTYRERIQQRQDLFAKHGQDVLNALPGSELACKELMEMAVQFLCARYPTQFQLTGNTLVNRILNTQEDVGNGDPLKVLLNNVPEDFGIMLRDPETGLYCLRAGVICSSVGWNLGEKIGLGMPGIHRTVPDYKEKMQFSMDRFFTKMPTFKPIQRGSWGLEMGQPLYLPSDHPDFSHRETQDPSLRPEDINLRVDWQTLRRLPLSGAVVFNFKALFTPLTEFQNEPYIPSLVLKILNEGKESLMKYKGTWHVEHVVKPTLKEYERRQIEQGLVESDWNHQTLAEAPFFPGWETKWTSQ